MIKRLIVMCLFVLLGAGVGFATSEVLVRMTVPLSDFLWEWDPLIGMKLIAGKKGRSVKAGVYDVSVDINSAGFRDREHVIGKPLGVCRVALIGDSFVEALQVPFEDSITSRIEERLKEYGIRAEAINFGVSGAGTAREYLTVRSYTLPYRPDLVLLFFVANDFGGNTFELKGLPYIPYPRINKDGSLVLDEAGHPSFAEFHDQQSRFPVLAGFVRDHFKTYRLLREVMDTLPPPGKIASVLHNPGSAGAASAVHTATDEDLGPFEMYRSQLKQKWAVGQSVTDQLIVATRDLAAENDVQFAVVMVPSAFQVYPERWNELLAETPSMREAGLSPDTPTINLERFLVKNHVTVIDLLPDFKRHVHDEGNLYLRGDGHWTAAGHRLASEIVAREAGKFLNSRMECSAGSAQD